MSSKRIVDLSYPLDPATPVYPDYPPVEISILEATGQILPDRRALNSSRLAVGMHCGTHMDAPFHFFERGRTIDQIPLERFAGPAFRLDLRAKISGGHIAKEHLEPHAARLREFPKVVLHTGWAERWGTPEYFSEHPLMSAEAAQFLVESGVHLVGLDMPSVDRPPFPAHLTLLGNDVVIVENLTNLEVLPGVFELIVLPLKITAREASPVRAIARAL
jgi:kynurenine formamidase